MIDNIRQFLANGPARRDAMEAFLDKGLNKYLGPTGLLDRLPLVAELNPVRGMEHAGGASQAMFKPGASGWDRLAAGGRMASEIAGVAVPMGAARFAGSTTDDAARAIQEALTGMSARPGTVAAKDFAADQSGAIGRTDDITARGDQVLSMLKGGRGSEVTDDMLDLGDPVQNARLNEYLFNNYDLPMDEASRMGRAGEMGAVPEYHGTTTGTDMRYPSAGYSSGTRKGIGFVTSSDPNVANTYADPKFGGVFPMMNATPPSGLAEVNAGGALWSEVPREAPFRLSGGESAPLSSYAQGPADVGGVYDTNQIARGASFNGDGGVRILDVEDNGIHGMNTERPGPSTVTMRQDTRGMRSRFARFDPRLAHLRNLSASVGGIAALPILEEQMRAYLDSLPER